MESLMSCLVTASDRTWLKSSTTITPDLEAARTTWLETVSTGCTQETGRWREGELAARKPCKMRSEKPVEARGSSSLLLSPSTFFYSRPARDEPQPSIICVYPGYPRATDRPGLNLQTAAANRVSCQGSSLLQAE